MKTDDQYCEKVLDRDPENSQAYLGKLMAELNIRNREDLINCDKNFDTNSNYQKVLRYGDEKLVQELKNCVADIDKRNRYNYAVKSMNAAVSEEAYKAASEAFGVLGGFKDSDILAKSCLEKAEECRKENIYHSASSIALVTAEACEKAQKLFESISGWKDSDERISYCRTTAEKLRAKAEADRLERERKSELAKSKQKKTKKRIKKIAIIATPIVCVCIVSVIILFTVIIPKIKYKNALEMLKNGHYDDAYALFEELEDTDKITESKRERADQMLENEQYDDAYALLEEIGDKEAISESKYTRAKAFIDSNEDNQAYMLLNGLDYKDAQQIVKDFVFVPSKMVDRSNIRGRVTTEYIYDKNGNLTKEICSEVYYTYITEYIYDENGNLIKKIRSEIHDNVSTIESSVEYSYDTSGKLVKDSLSWSDGTTETEYTYNENGTLRMKVSRQYDGIVTIVTTYYEYDENGNILIETASVEGLHGNSSTTIHYSYWDDKLLKKYCRNSESDQGDSDTEYRYDQNGNLIEEFFLDWYGNQISYQYSYDEVGNLKKIEKTDSHGNAYNIVATIEYSDYQIFYRPE